MLQDKVEQAEAFGRFIEDYFKENSFFIENEFVVDKEGLAKHLVKQNYCRKKADIVIAMIIKLFSYANNEENSNVVIFYFCFSD